MIVIDVLCVLVSVAVVGLTGACLAAVLRDVWSELATFLCLVVLLTVLSSMAVQGAAVLQRWLS